MYNYCTIITESYFPYVLALLESIKRFQKNIHLNVLISDKTKEETKISYKNYSNISVYFSEELCRSGLAEIIYSKYSTNYHDAFRWSMKPVFLKFLVSNKNVDKIIYLDSDLYFYNDPTFLFYELDNHNIILTPHWRSSNPRVDPNNFHILLTNGHYNAGFLALNKNAIQAMDWWADVCAYKCEKNASQGLFDDQSYLDLFHIYFDKVKVLKHKGCNVANWNQIECKRIPQKDGSVLINDEKPIVFIHYTGSTIRGILNGQDESLLPYLLEYEKALKKQGVNTIEKARESIIRARNSKGNTLIAKLDSKFQLKRRLKTLFENVD